MHGEIASHWEWDGNKVTWSIRVPANTTARVYVPSEPDTAVAEGGVIVDKALETCLVGREGKFLVVQVSSGDYSFESTLRLDR